jgi:hypothetical protein
LSFSQKYVCVFSAGIIKICLFLLFLHYWSIWGGRLKIKFSIKKKKKGDFRRNFPKFSPAGHLLKKADIITVFFEIKNSDPEIITVFVELHDFL